MFFLTVHFFTCIKKRTKESAAVHLSLLQRDALRCSQREGASESRTPLGVFITPCGVLHRTAIPLFTVLLGYVKWLKNKDIKMC
jgi:hypothetical protein